MLQKTPIFPSATEPTRGGLRPLLALRFALREMRGGLRGFFVFLACIALGVAAIGGVNSVARSISAAVDSQGQEILGGEIRFRLTQREANDAEKAWIASLGTVSESASMRSMAQREDGSNQALVEVKAVDGAYPLYGSLVTDPPLDHETLFGERDGAFGAVAPSLLLDRLGIRVGERVKLGRGLFEIRAVLVTEPDAVSESFGFAPRLMVSLDGLKAAGLIQPGSLFQYAYRVKLAEPPSGSNALKSLRNQASKLFPQAGWNVRTFENAAPSLSSNVERFSQFLTLVGLTALVVGGVGVANAVRAYLDSKRSVIATFKSLGASGNFVVLVYLLQIMLIALVGIAAGLALGAMMPFGAQAALQQLLPIPSEVGFYPRALALAAVFGILTTLAFALLPLGRARDVPATALFREMGFEARGWPRKTYVVAALAIAVALALLAIFHAQERRIATIFVVSAVCAFLVLRLVGDLVQTIARHAPRVRSTALRLAIGNIHRPGALTPSVVVSLGLGLTLLATLALIDGNLRRQIGDRLPDVAPNFFFVDIQPHEIEDFSMLVERELPGKLIRVPMLRGRVVELNGKDTRNLKVAPEGEWVLRGDRGITYSATVPENSTLVEGEWWPENYDGEPLVSFSAQEGKELGLKLGDTITVNVLGRNITARIANFRRVEWETLAMNFVMVFSPNTFAGAPHAWLSTLTAENATPEEESRLLNAITRAFPTVTSIRVKDALDVVNELVSQLSTAIRAAASVALIASVLVLSGALAADSKARVHDAVVLKTLGATRRMLVRAFAYEYLLIGLATAIFGLLAGAVASWYVVARIMKLSWTMLPEVAVGTVALALVLTVVFGLIGTWRVLGHKAAPVLRNL